MRQLGCTRVELGVQHIDDKILKLNRRGHTAEQSIKAIKLLKNAGFKINLHLMLNLYGSTPAKDSGMFETIYSDSNWMPDMVKIYPCVVNENADLYKLYKQGKYKPYTKKQLLDLIIKIKKITPPWVRITRLIRDIPEESIVAGNKTTNLRQLIGEQATKDGWQCKCIRCREAGHQLNCHPEEPRLMSGRRGDLAGLPRSSAQGGLPSNDIKLKKIKYKASDGTEYFLSYESPDKRVIYAFLRLRLNVILNKAKRSEGSQVMPRNPSPEFTLSEVEGTQDDIYKTFPELQNAALIREVHTYGQLAELGKIGEVQHLGLGKKLIAEAEKIAQKEFKKTCPECSRKIVVISGIGVREYYKKLGYRLEGTYMVKYLK